MSFSINKNYYQILNTDPSATSNEIKKAYYKLAKETHPDKNPGSDGEAFKRIHEAYDVLINDEKRRKYDDFLVQSNKNSFIQTQQFSNGKRNAAKETKSEDTDDFFAKFRASFAQQQKARQKKENEVAKQRMNRLNLSQEEQIELWQIHQEFSRNATHFKQMKYSAETIKNLLFIFCDISLSHLDEECRNNPDIVDVSFHHSFTGLRYASKDVIMTLLDRKDSVLYKELTHSWNSSEFLQHYPYDVDTNVFIKLMTINPTLIKSLPQNKILEFLRDPKCRQHKETLPVNSLYQSDYKYGLYNGKTKNSIGNHLEILFEIYQHYNRNILRQFNFLDSFSQNSYQLRQLAKRLFTKYPNEIDFRDILSIDKLIDQESLCFSYDAAQETLTCTGTLSDEGDSKKCTFVSTHKIMAKNESWYDSTFICELASSLDPKIFCKMLASIPLEKRVQYLFSNDKYDSDSAYYAYNDLLNRTHYSSNDEKDNMVKTEKTKEHLDALAELIYPGKPMSADNLTKAKEQICASLHNYTAFWKLSIFGHHHESRARHVIKTINNASSLAQIGLIIENQLALLESKSADPLFQTKNRQFILKRIFDNQSIDWQLLNRWYESAPKNVPLQKEIMNSGYYRALKSAKDIITNYNNPDRTLIDQSRPN